MHLYVRVEKSVANAKNGETCRMVKARLSDHRGYISNQGIWVATGDRFNLPGHSLADLIITALERVKKKDENWRKERENISLTN